MSSSKIKIPAIFFRSNDQPSPIRCTNRQLNIKCCIEYQLCIHVMSTETTRSFYESKRQQFTVWRQRRENANTTSMTKHQKKISMYDEQTRTTVTHSIVLYLGQSRWTDTKKTLPHSLLIFLYYPISLIFIFSIYILFHCLEDAMDCSCWGCCVCI